MCFKKVLFIFPVLMMICFLLSGCEMGSESKIKNAEFNQVTDGGTLQNRGNYTLKKGTLHIFKEIQRSTNLDQDPSELKLSDNVKERKKLLANEFSDEEIKLSEEELFQTFTKEIKNSYVRIDTKDKKTYLHGENYEKEFNWLEENGKRLIDSNKVEYSFEK